MQDYTIPSASVLEQRGEELFTLIPSHLKSDFMRLLVQFRPSMVSMEPEAVCFWIAHISDTLRSEGKKIQAIAVMNLFKTEIGTLFSDASDEWKEKAYELFLEINKRK